MIASTRDRLPLLGPAVLALAVIYQIVAALRPEAFLVQNVFVMDDAFYYFQVAWNHGVHGFATFDGIHESSGIQILWGIVLGALARVVDDKIGFLRAILFLCIALNVVAGLQLRRLGRQLFGGLVGEVACAIWAGFMLALTPTMIGMEYSLHVIVVIPTMALLARVWRNPADATTKQLVALGCLLTLNFWVRLDSAVFTLVIAVGLTLCAWLRTRRMPWREGLALIAPPALGTVLFAITCYWLAETITPLSGMVKRHYSATHFDDTAWYLAFAGHASWWVKILFRPMLDVACSSLTESLSWSNPIILALCAAITWWTWRTARSLRADRGDDAESAAFLGRIWITTLVHAALVVVVVGHFAHVTQHYYAWAMMTWCLWVALMIVRTLERLSPRARRRALAIGCTLLLVAHAFAAWRQYERNEEHLHIRRLPALEWIEENIPVDARIGSWNAGQIGYFADQTVVNLDGLANDRHFLDRLKANASTLDYLRAEKIEYLIDVNGPDQTMPYRADWDRSTSFRRLIPQSALEVLWREDRENGPIEILRVKPE